MTLWSGYGAHVTWLYDHVMELTWRDSMTIRWISKYRGFYIHVPWLLIVVAAHHLLHVADTECYTGGSPRNQL